MWKRICSTRINQEIFNKNDCDRLFPGRYNEANSVNKNELITYLKHDINNNSIPFKAKFDIIILFGVLEHVRNIPLVLIKAKKMLSSNGHILITSSNRSSIYSIQKRIYEFFGIWKYGYTKNYTKSELLYIIQKSGFSIKNARIVGCNRENSVLSFFDRLLCTIFQNGRYIFIEGKNERTL